MKLLMSYTQGLRATGRQIVIQAPEVDLSKPEEPFSTLSAMAECMLALIKKHRIGKEEGQRVWDWTGPDGFYSYD